MKEATFGEKAADFIVDKIGTWAFVLWQLTAYALWIAFNVSAYFHHYDPYPFILLNLALSFQAALATSFVLIS